MQSATLVTLLAFLKCPHGKTLDVDGTAAMLSSRSQIMDPLPGLVPSRKCLDSTTTAKTHLTSKVPALTAVKIPHGSPVCTPVGTHDLIARVTRIPNMLVSSQSAQTWEAASARAASQAAPAKSRGRRRTGIVRARTFMDSIRNKTQVPRADRVRMIRERRAFIRTIQGTEGLMVMKEHGTCPKPVQTKLRWNCDREVADQVCCFNRHSAERKNYFLETSFLSEENAAQSVTFYDSVTGKPLFVAPRGRSWEHFVHESKAHGWPSFRDAEVVKENVRVLDKGETVSVDGSHLGHNLLGDGVNRYCINLVAVAGHPEVSNL